MLPALFIYLSLLGAPEQLSVKLVYSIPSPGHIVDFLPLSPTKLAISYKKKSNKKATFLYIWERGKSRPVELQSANVEILRPGPAGTILGSLRSLKLTVGERTLVQKGRWHRIKQGRGISLFSPEGEEAFLFFGQEAAYSPEARLLSFGLEGFLYLWNPVRGKKKGLIILGRGYSPVWSPDGKALAYLQSPFSCSGGKVSGRGGISIVDMFFRRFRVTEGGGELSWAPDRRWIYFCQKLGKKPAVWRVPLRGTKPRPKLLLRDRWSPRIFSRRDKALLAVSSSEGIELFALPELRRVTFFSRGVKVKYFRNFLFVSLPSKIQVWKVLSR